MEDKQMLRHKFFRKIGAFSVNLDEPRAAIKSLRYAVDSMDRPNSSLFIYPEGEIVPFSTQKPTFRKGLPWIADRVPDSEIVPIAIYIHTARYDKPELHIKVGQPVLFQSNQSTEELNSLFEKRMQQLLSELQRDALKNPSLFRKV